MRRRFRKGTPRRRYSVQQNVERSEVGVVFWVSAAVALAFTLWGAIAPASFGAVTQGIFDWVVTNLG
jgi:choline-glycine betaine transporter